MSYDTGTPQATDRVSDTQQPILTNFQQLNSVYGVDHYAYDDGSSNATRHRKVTLPSAAGIPSSAAGVGAMYAKTTSSVTWPFWRRDGSATDFPMMPIKAMGTVTSTSSPSMLQQLNINTVSTSAAGTFSFTFATALLTDAYAIVATPFNASANPYLCVVQVQTASGFTILFYRQQNDQSFKLTNPDFFYFLCVEAT